MSYSTYEPIQEIMTILKSNLPGLQKILWRGGKDIEVLHPSIEMIASLIARYDRGEIIEKIKTKKKVKKTKLV